MNIDLIEDALADAALEPAKHDQRTYFSEGIWHALAAMATGRSLCGSTRCLAGFIAERAGWVLSLRQEGPHVFGVATREGVTQAISDAAMDEAELTYSEASFLFDASNTDDLKQLQARWEYMKAQCEKNGPLNHDWRPPR